MKRSLSMAILGLGLLVPFSAGAEVPDPLLQKLVEKGTLSPAEAADIQSKKAELPAALKGLSIGGVAFIDYSFGQTGGAAKTNYNRFTIQRGYLNIFKDITPWLKARITPDIKASASATGDYTIRMKYLYADFLTPDLGPLNNIDIKAGIIQTPFLEFEESINGYRMQSPMFQDKRGLQTSADLGVSTSGYLGGRLTKEQTEGVGSSSFAGRYGSYSVGVYNGGGYGAATENNQDKSVHGRLSFRPLPDILPGLQLTYSGIAGKANLNDSATGRPEQWINNTGLLSFQHRFGAVTAEYFSGAGSSSGDTGSAKHKEGYSFFARLALPMYEKIGLFGRFDSLDPDKDSSDNRISTTIGGVSYRITGQNYLVAAYEKTHDQAKAQDDKKGQIALQVVF